jgi:hypothetical protein
MINRKISKCETLPQTIPGFMLTSLLVFPSSFHRHPGCQCPAGFNGAHCEFLDTPATSPPAGAPATSATSGIDDEGEPYNPNEGLVIGLAVTFVALAAIVMFAVIKRMMHSRGVAESAKDVASVDEEGVAPPADDASATPATEASETSGPTPFEAEETVFDDLGASPEKGDLETVEII